MSRNDGSGGESRMPSVTSVSARRVGRRRRPAQVPQRLGPDLAVRVDLGAADDLAEVAEREAAGGGVPPPGQAAPPPPTGQSSAWKRSECGSASVYSPMSISPGVPRSSVLSPSRTCRSTRTSRSSPRPWRRRAALLSAPEPSALVTRRLERPCVYSCQTRPESSPPLICGSRGGRRPVPEQVHLHRRRLPVGRRRHVGVVAVVDVGPPPAPVAAPSSVWVCTGVAAGLLEVARALVEADRRALRGGRGSARPVEGLDGVLELVRRPRHEARSSVLVSHAQGSSDVQAGCGVKRRERIDEVCAGARRRVLRRCRPVVVVEVGLLAREVAVEDRRARRQAEGLEVLGHRGARVRMIG